MEQYLTTLETTIAAIRKKQAELTNHIATLHSQIEQLTHQNKELTSQLAAATKPLPEPSLNPLPTDAAYKGPLIITKGGTYTGNWQSTDAAVPAVEVRTSEPVIIEHSNILGAGLLITSVGYKVNLTVRNTRGYGLTPNKAGRERRFVNVGDFKNVVVENCYLEHTAGIYLATGYHGNGTEKETIKIRYNVARNIDGRIFGGKRIAQFVQFNFKGAVPHAEIAWNEIVNEPGKSAVEDTINLYNTQGVKSSPIHIHHNYLQGAYAFPLTDKNYSGGGIITDGDGDLGTATAHVLAEENQLVNAFQYNMGIGGGNHITYKNNRIVNSGLLPDGSKPAFYSSGMWGKDYYKKNTTFNNLFEGNYIAVNYNHTRNEISIAQQVTLKDNTIPEAKATQADEKAEWGIWQQRVQENKIRLGVS